MTEVAVIGAGYVGTVTAACLASKGLDVRLIEIRKDAVERMKKGDLALYEPGLEEMFREHLGENLSVTSDETAIKGTDYSVICVGTPPKDGHIDTRYVVSAAEAVKRNAGPGHTCILRSTVETNTYRDLLKPILGDIDYGYWPEFLRQGHAVADWLNPSRVVYGTEGEGKAASLIEPLFPGSKICRMGVAEAETVKLASNSYLAVRLSFFNSLADYCKRNGVGYDSVAAGVGSDPRIGDSFMEPGIGYGGSCLSKDTGYLIGLFERSGADPSVLMAAQSVNDGLIGRFVSDVERYGEADGMKIAVLGAAFNPSTDDIRNSRAVMIMDALLRKGAILSVYDPLCRDKLEEYFSGRGVRVAGSAREALEGTELCLILNPCPEFSRLTDEDFSVMSERRILEGRRVPGIDGAEGFLW
jgi:UDPglucose 6-dehydrogenase